MASLTMAMKKKTQGRKKIEIKMIEDENARRVTFSKRKNGVFKKASDLSTLCGVEIAIIIFSIGGKPFTFGHPRVENVLNRFLNEEKKVGKSTINSNDMKYKEEKCNELKQKFEKMHEDIKGKRKEGKALEKSLTKLQGYKSFGEFIEGLELDELMQLKEKMKGLKENMTKIGKDHDEEARIGYVEKHTFYGSPIPNDWLKL